MTLRRVLAPTLEHGSQIVTMAAFAATSLLLVPTLRRGNGLGATVEYGSQIVTRAAFAATSRLLVPALRRGNGLGAVLLVPRSGVGRAGSHARAWEPDQSRHGFVI